MKNFIVATKPLQLFNALNLDTAGQTIFCIVAFSGAENLINELKKISYAEVDFMFFSTEEDAYNYLSSHANSEDKIYIDSDYGLKKSFYLSKLKPKQIAIYEEGNGNYLNNLSTKINRPKNHGLIQDIITKFYLLLGNKDFLGGNKRTAEIIVYDKDRLLENLKTEKKVSTFKSSFSQHFNNLANSGIFYKSPLNEDAVRNQEVLLYLTNHHYNPDINSTIEKFNGLKIIKPHPAMSNVEFSNFDIVINSSYMAEFLILDLLSKSKKLTVVHENSSALQYISIPSPHQNLILNS